ncbi:glycoside hydrolase family 3 N-terminal domain-containing protein [Sphingomonas cynarae]|uniref:beta-glucosidase n=1 Tax=Sphingomonas cynarae TaxID=930197 RepID=A0ABP7DZX0_9SPHN
MKTPIAALLPLTLAAAAVASPAPVSGTGQAARTAQVALDEQNGPVIIVEGLRFRDLDRNGTLTPYEDWRMPVARRVDDLVQRMTLEDKAGTMMHGSLPATDSVIGASSIGYDRAGVERLIAGLKITSAITRLAVSPRRMAEENNALQAIAARTRLGIPLTISSDPRHHFQTVVGASSGPAGYSQWPETLGFAALRDPALMRRFSAIAAREYRATGIHQALSPQADLFTEPRWSRGTGTFGSDPAVARTLVQAYVAGFQGGEQGLTRDGVMAVVKHWVGYGANPEGFDGHNRYGRIAALDDASLQEHIEPFKGAFAAQVAGVMPTYDIITGVTIDGQPVEPVAAGFNRQLLDLLRTRYRFGGIILSDWGITRDCARECADPTRPQGPAEIAMPWGVETLSQRDRFVKGVVAGLDQFGGVETPGVIIDAVRAGTLAEARIDQSVARILTIKFQLGLFENPVVDPEAAARLVGAPAVRREAEEVQAAAQVLLKNDGGLLPLRAGTRVYLSGIDGAAARAHGLTVVDDPAQADVALVRAATPYETLHPLHFFGSRQHEGRLDLRPGDKDYDAVVRLARIKPVVMAIFLDRPAVLTRVAGSARAIIGNFGIGDDALLAAVTGAVAPRGRLPFELPRSMDAVQRQNPAHPDDSSKPLYAFGAGLSLPEK